MFVFTLHFGWGPYTKTRNANPYPGCVRIEDLDAISDSFKAGQHWLFAPEIRQVFRLFDGFVFWIATRVQRVTKQA